MENNKLNKVEEIEEIEETEMDSKPMGIGAKVVGGVKKHGKKVAIGVAAVVGLGLAYCLGAKSKGEEIEVDSYEFLDSDCEGDVSSEVEETE